MHRRDFLAGLAASTLSLGASAQTKNTRVAFGSCANQNWPQPIWDIIRASGPDAFVMLGDNIYADTLDMAHMADCYAKFGAIPQFDRFRRQIPIFATWDDHDYGWNDSGREYPYREPSKKLMLDFFGEHILSPRRFRPGVYTSYRVGRAPFDLQILLLDLRWFRSAIRVNEQGKYEADPATTPELLGEAQWQWLEHELRKPAGARIIASSIQMVSSEHRWERWAAFPTEKLRFERLLQDLDIHNAVVISGDMHFGEISKQTLNNGFELFDFTASGLNFTGTSQGIVNSQRLAVFDRSPCFGIININWTEQKITGEIRDYRGLVTAEARLSIPLGTVGV